MAGLPHVIDVIHQLATILETYTPVVVWASGGKDSLTLLHLLQPWATRVTVLFNDVDGEWPGVQENLRACLMTWGFEPPHVIHPLITYEAYVAQYGYPMELVPCVMDGAGFESPFYVGGAKVSSWMQCTVQRFVLPILAASMALKAHAVITGSRSSDAPAFLRMGRVLDASMVTGFVRYNPLIHWTTEQVYAYVDAHAIPLPAHYAWKRHATYDVPDCMGCTWFPQHWQTLKDLYPHFYAEHWPDVAPVYREVKQHLDQYQQSLNMLPEVP